MMWCELTLVATVLLHCGVVANQLNVKYKWKTPEFAFPSDEVKQAMISNGSYIPGNPFMLDVDVWNKGSEQKVFVTTPRFRPGTPGTVYVLSKAQGKDADPASPLLEPYPNWEWNRQGNCDSLTSVFRTQLDSCGRLWVIDSGVVDVITNFTSICPPQIVVFHVLTNRLVSRYRIPQQDLGTNSLLITIAADVRDHSGGKCRDSFAYVADVTAHALVVYDANRGKSWRVASSYFGPYPSATSFSIVGESFDLTDGVLGLALGPLVHGDRTLYFHSLASYKETWVRASVLRNESLFSKDTDAEASLFHESEGDRPSQTAATAMSKNSVLFFNLLSNTTLNCWNSRLPYTSQNLVELVKSEEALQFVSGMKVVQDKLGKETVWGLSCRFQKLMTGSFNTSEVNFRVVTAPVADLVKGTSCDSTLNIGHVHAARHSSHPLS